MDQHCYAHRVLRVKLSIPGTARNADISQFTGNAANTYGDCEFFVNTEVEQPDVWLVIEQPRPDDSVCYIARERTAYLAAEPSVYIGYWNNSPSRQNYLNQFGHVWTFSDVYFRDVRIAPPFLPWMINANHGPSIFAPSDRDVTWFERLREVPKSRSVSVICSNKTFSREHKLRLAFVTKAKERFRDRLDWYGNGVASIPSKWDGLAPYKFSLAIENRMWPNIFTEKLIDPFLALTVPVYWGAPNISDYFTPGSMVTIDLNDLRRSLDTIERLIEEDSYESYVPALLNAKHRVISEYNLVSRLADVAKQVAHGTTNSSAELIKLQSAHPQSFMRRRLEGAQSVFERLSLWTSERI